MWRAGRKWENYEEAWRRREHHMGGGRRWEHYEEARRKWEHHVGGGEEVGAPCRGSMGQAACHSSNVPCLAPQKYASPTARWTMGAASTTAWRRQASAAAAAHPAIGLGMTTGSVCPQVRPGWVRRWDQGGPGVGEEPRRDPLKGAGPPTQEPPGYSQSTRRLCPPSCPPAFFLACSLPRVTPLSLQTTPGI